MRWAVALVILSVIPVRAAESGSLCAALAPVPIKVTDYAAPAHAAAGPPAGGVPADPSATQALSHPPPAALASVAFTRHIAAAGATLTDLGFSHGMRVVAARNGDYFMLFDVTPDGQAAVSGAPIGLSLVQLRSVAAGNITDLGEMHGIRGFFVRSGAEFQVFYASPDGEQLIPGVMWDASGHDLTRQQVARVPGAIPTVEVGTAGRAEAAPSGVLPLIKKATFGTIGPASAPRLYMLIDPQCIYSIRAFQMLRPYAAAGRLQIAVVPLSILDYEDRGQSTRSALALLSDPTDQIVNAWQSGSENNAVSVDASRLLRNNMAIAREIGLTGTPTFAWRKPDGTEGRLDGLPDDVQALVASIRS